MLLPNLSVGSVWKALRNNTPESFEKSSSDVVKVHRTEIRQYQTQIDENGKKTQKWKY